MRPAERFFNILFGLSALSWAILGLAYAEPAVRYTPVRLAIAALNTSVGFLFLLRDPLTRHGSVWALAASLPSLMIGGMALRLAPSPETWPLQSQILFAAGLAWAVTSFLFLGRSFALLPAVRPIMTGGPFRLIRHPAYLGEFLAILCCSLAVPDLSTGWPAIVAAPLIVVRILAEERVLRSSEEYRLYAEKVRWRILPGVW